VLPNGLAWKNQGQIITQDLGTHEFVAVCQTTGQERHIAVEIFIGHPEYNLPIIQGEHFFGTTLSDIELPQGWAWLNPTHEIGNVGTHTHNAVFTPESPNLSTVTRAISVTVIQAVKHVEAPPMVTIQKTSTIECIEQGLPTGWEIIDRESVEINGAGYIHVQVRFAHNDINFQEVIKTLTVKVEQVQINDNEEEEAETTAVTGGDDDTGGANLAVILGSTAGGTTAVGIGAVIASIVFRRRII
jgi:hypothetical protein